MINGYEEPFTSIIKILYDPHTMDELVKLFPAMNRDRLREKLNTLRKHNTIIKIDNKFEVSPAYRKGNPVK